ncbi:MAG: DUF2341 domain-containing protein [Bdellovibrio sp.]|nr:MAG: DUF2341 domain-containing protein [Bdellovibrio sp.]
MSGGSLAAGASCTFVVEFVPTATGALSDTISVSYNDGASAQSASASVSGTGNNPAVLDITASPDSFNFGVVQNGSSKENTFTVTNNGNSTATLMAGGSFTNAEFSFNGGYPGGTGTCGATLAPAASCSIKVTFAPTASGVLNDTITLNYNDGATAQTATAAITGEGQSPANLSITPALYDFGPQATGSSTTQTLTITNTGDMTATGITGAGLTTAHFQWAGGSFPGGGTCGATLAGGGSTCTAIVEYIPQTVAAHSDTVQVDYNDGVAAQSATSTVQGTGKNPALLTSTPNTYNFGNQAQGSSTVQSFTIQNTGDVDATGISFPALSAPFSITANTCGATLAPSASCSVDVTYAPTTTGTYNDTLIANYNDGAGSQSLNVSLDATASSPATLTSTPASYDFGNVANMSTQTQTFTLQNTGGYTASGLSGGGLVAPYDYEGGSFPGTTGTCGTTLAPGASCTYVVSFQPTAVGAYSDTAVIDYNDGATNQQTSSNVTANVVAPALLSISDGPTYNYGTIARGATATKVFTVTNSGSVSATGITGAAFGSGNFDWAGGAGYPGTGGTCGATLAASSNCTIVVTYQPGANGNHTDQIRLDYNDGASAQNTTRDVAGVAVDPAILTFTPSTKDFGTVARGSTNVQLFTIQNTGGVDATLMTDGGGLSAPFSFTGTGYPGTNGTCGSTLTPSSTCTVEIQYAPTVNGLSSQSLDISFNNGVGAQVASAAVQGTAADPALLAITPNPHDFLIKAIGSTTTQTFTLTNSGGVAATNLAGVGLSTADFQYVGGSFPGGGSCVSGGSLAAGASCTFNVEFSPTVSGGLSDSIQVNYDDGAASQSATATVQGTGQTPASLTITVISDPFNFGVVATGDSKTSTYLVTNNGGVDATGISGGVFTNAEFSFPTGYPGTGGTCGATLAPANTCTIVVQFAPTASGVLNDTITINYNDGVNPQSATAAIQGEGQTRALLSITPDPYDFGTQAVGSSTTQTFTVSNSGQITATSLADTGLGTVDFRYPGGFPGGGTCGATLAGGSSCTVIVEYIPQATGAHSDTISIQYNDGVGTVSSTATVQGTGTTPASIGLNPAEANPYNYGTAATGATVSKTFTIENTGGVAATGLTISVLTGTDFRLNGTTCGATLNPAASCTITVDYVPTTTGAHSDTLRVSYNNGASNVNFDEGLSGTGANPAQLDITANPDPFNFGIVAVGQTLSQTFTVTNNGGVDATGISGAAFINATFTFTGGSFPGTGGTCGATLTPAATCTVQVSFSPVASGVVNDTLQINYNNGASATNSIAALQGEGKTKALLTIAPDPQDFGTQAVGSSTTATLTITNSGELTATSIADNGFGTAYFRFVGGAYPGGGTCGTSLAGGANCTIVVEYLPTTAALHTDNIDLQYNDGVNSVNVTSAVQGTGANPAVLTFNPAEPDPYDYFADYGKVANGATVSKTFTVQNTGGVTATGIAPSTVTGSVFTVNGGTCGATLAASSSCTIIVDYSPTASGTQTDTLKIDYNDGASAQSLTNGLTGQSGAPANLTISEVDPYDFGNVASGGALAKVFTVTNIGGVTATGLSGAAFSTADYRYEVTGSFPGNTGTCGSTLAAGSNCNVVVEFIPQSVANGKTDTLTINYNNGVSAQNVSRNLTGNGVNPALLTISDGPTYDYGTQAVNSVTEKVFTVSFTGDVDATGVTAGGTLAVPFRWKGGSYPGTGGTCGAVINASCTIVVEFAPTATGTPSSVITLSYNNGASTVNTTRNVTGTAVTEANISISETDPYDFGTIAATASITHTFTLTNTGQFTASTLSEVGLAAPYSLAGGWPGAGGTCGATLAGGASCDIVVTFNPTSNGLKTDTISIQYDTGATTTTSNRQVQGTAADPALLVIAGVNPYDYGNKALGSSTDQLFTITNSGGVTATGLSEIGLAAPFGLSGPFPGTNGTCGNTLASGNSCTIEVRFTPTALGLATDSIEMQYNNGLVTTSVTLGVQGTGVNPALLTISDGPLYDFGNQEANCSKTKTFTVTNTGDVDATAVNGTGLAGEFKFLGGFYPGTGGSCGATISAAGGSCTIVVEYAPVNNGMDTDTIQINYYDGVVNQSATRDIQGNGLLPGPISTAQSLLTVSNDKILLNGTITVTLDAKDSCGNNISTGGETVIFSNSGGTAGVTWIGAVSDNADGTYTQDLRGDAVGSATLISATINGNAVTSPLPSAEVIYEEFYRTISIAPAISQNDKQIRIVLNSGNFNYANAAVDGSDLRFVDATLTPYPHWIENWNPSGDSVVWVKLPAGTTTMDMYYGNPNFTDVSDADTVFSYSTQKDLYAELRMNGAMSTSVASYTNGNQVTVTLNPGTATQVINDGAVFTFASMYYGLIKAMGPISARALNKDRAYDTVVPVAWATTLTGYMYSRSSANTNVTDKWSIYNPNSTVATVTVEAYDSSGALTNTYSTPVNPGQNVELTGDVNNSGFGIATSDIPVLFFYHGNNSADGMPLQGGSTELIGVASNGGYLGMLENGTSGTYYLSDGNSGTFSGNKGNGLKISGASGSQGTAQAVYIVANKRLVANTQADGDGSESVGFWPVDELNKEYIIPATGQYIAVACIHGTTNITVYNPDTTVYATGTCTPSGNIPGKAYFGTTGSSTPITAGMKVVADRPIYIYYEYSNQDETNVLGHKQARLIELNGTEPVGTPGAETDLCTTRCVP